MGSLPQAHVSNPTRPMERRPEAERMSDTSCGRSRTYRRDQTRRPTAVQR
jgi:hypothetical protein